MPADLKKVAREIGNDFADFCLHYALYKGGTKGEERCVTENTALDIAVMQMTSDDPHDNAEFYEKLESRLSEVRAQAMEEAAKICDHETAYQSQYAHGIAREPMRAMGHIISEAIRRCASGKDEE
jgi:hypothetical protein